VPGLSAGAHNENISKILSANPKVAKQPKNETAFEKEKQTAQRTKRPHEASAEVKLEKIEERTLAEKHEKSCEGRDTQELPAGTQPHTPVAAKNLQERVKYGQ